jgi:hypothetical protein
MSFLPQKVVQQDVWIGGFHRRYSFKQQYPRREMKSTTHLNEQMQYTSQS